MSLTSFIATPDVRKRFREEFPRRPVPWKNVPLAPPRTTNYALVGIAFDYLLRFYLRRLNPEAKTSRWVAEMVPPLLAHNKEAEDKAAQTVADAKRTYEQYLVTGEIDDCLLTSVLSLARLDPIFRAGRGQDYIGRVDAPDLNDLRALISLGKSVV